MDLNDKFELQISGLFEQLALIDVFSLNDNELYPSLYTPSFLYALNNVYNCLASILTSKEYQESQNNNLFSIYDEILTKKLLGNFDQLYYKNKQFYYYSLNNGIKNNPVSTIPLKNWWSLSSLHKIPYSAISNSLNNYLNTNLNKRKLHIAIYGNITTQELNKIFNEFNTESMEINIDVYDSSLLKQLNSNLPSNITVNNYSKDLINLKFITEYLPKYDLVYFLDVPHIYNQQISFFGEHLLSELGKIIQVSKIKWEKDDTVRKMYEQLFHLNENAGNIESCIQYQIRLNFLKNIEEKINSSLKKFIF